MIYDERKAPTTGIEIDVEGRVLLWFRDQFGRLRSKHLLFVDVTRRCAEFRRPHGNVTVGVLLEDEQGNWFIRIDLPDFAPP